MMQGNASFPLATYGSLRLPRPPSGRAPAQGIPLASPYSPLAGCVSALPAYSLSLIAACLDVQPPRLRRLPSPSGIAARGIPPHPMEASGFLDPLRVEPPRMGGTPCLPVQPASGLRLGSAAYSLSLVAASLDVPPSTGGEGGTPLHPLARLLPRQSAARKRSDTCRETRGLVRSVSRYVTSSPSHSGRHEELHPLFCALSLCK